MITVKKSLKKMQYNVTQCDYTLFRGDLRVMNSSNTNISLHIYTCTSYFQEYIIDNKYENVNIMSY
jgi:hypothetical protein